MYIYVYIYIYNKIYIYVYMGSGEFVESNLSTENLSKAICRTENSSNGQFVARKIDRTESLSNGKFIDPQFVERIIYRNCYFFILFLLIVFKLTTLVQS